jgi:uncharacterized protein with PIN domain
MISKHCNVRLIPLNAGREYSYFEDTKTKKRFHMWRCAVCQKTFQQGLRMPAIPKVWRNQGGKRVLVPV